MLDYKHIQTSTEENGTQLLSNDILEIIHEHTCIDILNDINVNVNKLISHENIEDEMLSGDNLRKRALSKLLKDTLYITKSQREREKILLRTLDLIKNDKHCIEIICLQLIEKKSKKPDEIEREICDILVSSADPNEDPNPALWELDETILSEISERYAKFFKSYLMYLVNKYIEHNDRINNIHEDNSDWYNNFINIQDKIKQILRRIKLLHSKRKLKGPTEQYLNLKKLKLEDVLDK